MHPAPLKDSVIGSSMFLDCGVRWFIAMLSCSAVNSLNKRYKTVTVVMNGSCVLLLITDLLNRLLPVPCDPWLTD